MPRPALRSKSLRKVKKKSPSGVSIVHYYRKKPSPAKCRICKKPLHGVPRDINSGIRKLSKTKRKPERPFGGNLCSACSRETIKGKFTNIVM